jgi:pimeloyl-ACP methyl ester carboxylesterase
MIRRSPAFLAIALALVAGLTLIWWRFNQAINTAAERASQGSVMIETRCGPIEYQEAGAGVPLLMVHGSGGGHDQGMAFAGALAGQGIRLIAMSRFGYLRTPMPADGSPAAQADAHICLLDALGIGQAAILGASAGAPSAMQTAIRHPDRISALVLLVPLAYKPGTAADSAPPLSPLAEKTLMRLIGSDFVFWAALHMARDQVIGRVLATPPELLASASPQERARVDAIAENILPVSARADGLRADSALGKTLTRYALESIRAPTLIISARDDGYLRQRAVHREPDSRREVHRIREGRSCLGRA